MSPRTWAVTATLVCSTVALTQGTGLASAPAATTLGHKKIQFQYRQTSRDNALDSRYRKNFQTVYGIFRDAEISFDTNLDDDFRLGGKYTLFKGDKGFLASVGVYDALENPELYLAAKFDLDDNQIHFGVIDTEDKTAFVGFRRMLTDDFRFTADHLTGPSGRTSFRGDYNFTESWRATLRVYFPNESSSPRTHRFEIAYRMTID